MGKLAPIVMAVAAPLGLVTFLTRHKAPRAITALLTQSSVVGTLVALSCNDLTARYTTALMGKRSDGQMKW